MKNAFVAIALAAAAAAAMAQAPAPEPSLPYTMKPSDKLIRLSRDLLEERARAVLGFADPRDYVVRVAAPSAPRGKSRNS